MTDTPGPCGCRVVETYPYSGESVIRYCPTHAAAPDRAGWESIERDAQVLLDALKTAQDNLLPDKVLGPYFFAKAELAAKRLRKRARAAIASVKEDTDA